MFIIKQIELSSGPCCLSYKNNMASSSKTSTKKIKLKSSDGQTFEVEEAVAMQSETIKSIIEVIPISEVTSKTLSLVIEYCNDRLANQTIGVEHKDDHLRDWALQVFQADQSAFFDLVLAAHYLKIKSLEDLTSQIVADIIRGKSLEEIRRIFNINSFHSS